MRAGHRQGRTAGDPWQLGGAFVIDTAGRIRFAHAEEHSGDNADLDDLLDAVRLLVGDRRA